MLRDKIYRVKQLKTTIKMKKELINWLRGKVQRANFGNILAQGGKKEDKVLKAVIQINKMEADIKEAIEELDILNPFVNEELELLKEHEPIVKKIIELRELRGMTWDKIAEAVHYSRSQCIRIFNKNYKYKR